MAVSVLIPTPSRKFTAGEDTVSVQATTVREMVDALDAAHPGLGKSLRKPDGSLNLFINIYVNDEDIRFLQGADTPLKDGDQVSIVPAIAGELTLMAVERFNLTFNRLMQSQPIVYNLGKKYRLVTVIEKANVSEEAGWMQIAFNGDGDEIQRAIADLNTLGVTVTPTEIATLS